LGLVVFSGRKVFPNVSVKFENVVEALTAYWALSFSVKYFNVSLQVYFINKCGVAIWTFNWAILNEILNFLLRTEAPIAAHYCYPSYCGLPTHQ